MKIGFTDRVLRIAIVRQRYRFDGGAEQIITRTLETLQGDRIELTIISRRWKAITNVKRVICNPFYVGRFWREASFARCVCKHIQNGQYDVVQAHEKIPCATVYRAGDGVHREWLRQRSRSMNLFSRLAQSLSLFHRYLLWAEKRLFESNKIQAVICISEMNRGEVLRNFKIDPAKVRVIYCGVDVDIFNPSLRTHRNKVRVRLGIPEDAIIYLFVGSGFHRKGLPVVLKALSNLPPNTHLVVVGYDKKLGRYKKYCVKQGIANRVHFEGKQEDVKPYYGAADVLVHPAIYEPFSNMILEAMASGLAVVTSYKCGAAELLREGENGYICDSLDTEALTYYMRKLLTDDLVAMGDAARRAAEPYTLQRMNDSLVSLYNQILGE